jgi:hypothetical protein
MISAGRMNKDQARQKRQPWKPADATDAIRSISQDANFTLDLTGHARDQMKERDIVSSDLLHVLKNGFVYDQPEPATVEGCFKYKIESKSPAGAREVRIVAIPWNNPPEIKIVTVMWRDEVLL